VPTFDNLPTDLGRNRILPTWQSADFTGNSYSEWRAKYSRGETPPAIRIGKRKLGWRLGDLIDWIEARAEPDRLALVAVAQSGRRPPEKKSADRPPAGLSALRRAYGLEEHTRPATPQPRGPPAWRRRQNRDGNESI
jgi:predicted DNA-binding transcriptional regulator AlpA